MNKRKTFLFALAALAALAVAALCLACDKKPSGITPTPGDDGDPEKFVTSITYSGEYRQEYYEGEAFDPMGLIVTATWYDGDTETITPRDYTIEPAGALTVGMTSVRIVYEDNFADIPITVNGIAPISIDVTGAPDMTQYYGNAIDLTDLAVNAVVASGTEIPLTVGTYTVELDGEAFVSGSKPERGVHTLSVKYKTFSSDFDFVVIDGTRIEAEKIIDSVSITEEDRDFVEKTEGQPFKMVSNNKASGGAYMGSVEDGSVILFHVWADKAGKATLILRAASGSVVPSRNPDNGSSNWASPVQANAMNFSQSAAVKVKAGGSDEFASVSIDNNITLPGGVALDSNGKYNPDGDPDLWIKWFDVPFGEFEFAAGDNIVEITINKKMNIDRFEIRYLSDDHAHDGRAMIYHDEVAPTCQSGGIAAYYTCALCGKMYNDKNGNDELFDIMRGKIDHDYELSANADYKKDYYEFEQFDKGSLALTGKCVMCDGTADLTGSARIDVTSMTVQTESVKVYIGDKYLTLPVTVTPIIPIDIEISGVPDQTQYFGIPVSLDGLQVTAVTADGKKFVLGTDVYTVKLDGEVITESDITPDCDIHTVTVEFKGKSKGFDLVVIDGTRIEAESIIATGSIKPSDKNFVEKTVGQPFNKVSPADASGGAYMGNVEAGSVILFHVWADKAGKATLILRAASGDAVLFGRKPDGSTNWGSPIQVNTMIFSQSATVRVKSSGSSDFVSLSINDQIALPGGIAVNADGSLNNNGDPKMWVNWFDVPFGEFEFAAGDNIVEITINKKMNIDRFEIRYLPDDHAHDGRGMVYHAGVTPTCQAVGTREYYTCGLCGKMFADEDGTVEIFDIMLAKGDHNYENGTCTVCGAAAPASANALSCDVDEAIVQQERKKYPLTV